MTKGLNILKYCGFVFLLLGIFFSSGKMSQTIVLAEQAETISSVSATQNVGAGGKVTFLGIENRSSTVQRISWEAVPGVTGYEIYTNTKQTGRYTLAATVKGANKTYVDIKSLSLGKTYYYKLRTFTTKGGKTTYGAYSVIKNKMAAPADPKLTAATLTADKEITITWSKVSEADGYIVYRKVGVAKKWVKVATIDKKTVTSYTQKGLKLATAYSYTVAAYKLNGRKTVIGSYDTVGKTMCTAFTIDAKSTPYNGRFVKNANYNAQTRQYFLIRSYLEYFSEIGGGKLILKKGTYNIPCILYVPSNVEIELQNGTVINKSASVGKKSTLTPSSRLFVFIDNNGKDIKNGTKGYNGVHDVNIHAVGTATINMPTDSGYAFSFAHNNNIQISNIKMKMTGDSDKAIYVGGSQNITISGCTIEGIKDNSYGIWVDPMISGTTQYFSWAKMDNSTCKYINITKCTFKNLKHGVYTNRFVAKKYQNYIRLLNNSFSNITDDAVRALNWRRITIKNNKFTNIGEGAVVRKDMVAAIRLFGADTPTITNNKFNLVERAVHFGFTQNTDKKLSKHGTTVNAVSKDILNTIVTTNTFGTMGDYFVSIIAPKDVELTRVWIPDATTNLTMKATDTPYRNRYVWASDYNETSRQYYTFRSYLNQLEHVGGGTLTLKAGTYNLSFRLVIPSNVTLKFEDGVVINCAYKETENGVATGALFNLVSEEALDKGVKYTKYNGAHDIVFEGPTQGTAVINMNYMSAIGIKYAHCKNITIRNLTFNGLDASGSHYIECDASTNVLIENNVFKGYKYMSIVSNREAINLDIPDENTNGFTASYTSYDCTANDGVTIRNNVFDTLPSGVGTHIYTENHPHKNIKIYGNTFTNMNHYAIRAENWDGFEIYNNTIDKIGTKDEGEAIFFMGVMNAKVYQNVISNATCFIKARAAYYAEEFFSDKGSFFSATEKKNLLNYAMVQNDFTEADCERLGFYNNTLKNTVKYPCIMFRNNRNDSYVYWDMKNTSGYTVSKSSSSYMGSDEVAESDVTHDYRVIQSYLKRLEVLGGGTLTIKAGTYNICSTLYVPSNTTVVLESGVKLVKGTSTKYLFTTLPFSARDSEGTYSAYAAAQNVTIRGEYTKDSNGQIDETSMPVISLDVDNARQAIKIPQCTNVTISGINFEGSSSLAYIDIFSSKDVKISDCIFTGVRGSNDAKGVNIVSYYKNVVCKNVSVADCSFKNLYYGVYTKAGSAISVNSGSYHSGIKISGCTFSSMNTHNINGECWTNVEITGNTFRGPGESDSSGTYAIRLYYYGGSTLKIENNLIMNYYNGVRVPENFVAACEENNTFRNCFLDVRGTTGE